MTEPERETRGGEEVDWGNVRPGTVIPGSEEARQPDAGRDCGDSQ